MQLMRASMTAHKTDDELISCGEQKSIIAVSLVLLKISSEFPQWVNSFCIDRVQVLHIHKEVCPFH